MNRKVLYARFYESVYVPQIGEVGNTLPSPTKTLDNLHMTVTPIGLSVEGSHKGLRSEFLIPLASIKIMTLAPEEKPAIAAKASAVKLV